MSEVGTFRTDILGAPYRAETIELPADDEGPVIATLVHRRCAGSARGAVLHVHGFADYFFQTDQADFWVARGYDFYALDLRKYGRSLLPHQTACYAASMDEYTPELNEAWSRITARDGHTDVIVSAHSTGGLICPLWIAAHREALPQLRGLVLNSPWLDLRGPGLLRSAPVAATLDQLGRRRPKGSLPRNVTGYYGRSLHADHQGEFRYDLAWKPLESWPVHFGWLRAVRAGQARLHAGLRLDVPVLVLSSLRTGSPRSASDPVLHHSDIVLDVQQIRAWASSLGRHVTSIAVRDALHDVFLSLPAVRERAFAETSRWLAAWVDPSEVTPAGS